MKNPWRNISALIMAIVVLLSTMSFTVNMHYCNGKLVDTAIFQKAQTCGMEMDKQSSMKKKCCCEDKEIHIEGQDEIKLPVLELSSDEQVFVAFFLQSYINLFQANEKRKNNILDYPPPIIVRQIYKLDETYLI